MKVVLTYHARQRLSQNRQRGITVKDVLLAAENIPGKLSTSFKYKTRNSKGRPFDIVCIDRDGKRLITTIIGKDYGGW